MHYAWNLAHAGVYNVDCTFALCYMSDIEMELFTIHPNYFFQILGLTYQVYLPCYIWITITIPYPHHYLHHHLVSGTYKTHISSCRCVYMRSSLSKCTGGKTDLKSVTSYRLAQAGLGSIPFFQFNSNSNSVIFNSNSNSTTHNKFQFQFQFQFRRFQFQFQFQFRRFQIPVISIPEMTCWCLPWNWL